MLNVNKDSVCFLLHFWDIIFGWLMRNLKFLVVLNWVRLLERADIALLSAAVPARLLVRAHSTGPLIDQHWTHIRNEAVESSLITLLDELIKPMLLTNWWNLAEVRRLKQTAAPYKGTIWALTCVFEVKLRYINNWKQLFSELELRHNIWEFSSLHIVVSKTNVQFLVRPSAWTPRAPIRTIITLRYVRKYRRKLAAY